MHATTPLIRHLVLPRVLKVRSLDWPAADRARLASTLGPGRAAFIGPNHPEFMTDWMLDKEIASRVSPLMAHWASYEIVNMGPFVQAFWLSQNLIANAPGGGGREYSLRWAALGHGVLLHPEGTATFHARMIGTLVPGIVDMAWECVRRSRESGPPLEVHVVPITWALPFTRDVGGPLAREMAHVERALGLASGDGMAIERRFGALLVHLLERQCREQDVTPPRLDPAHPGSAYFDAQDACERELMARLVERYGMPDGPPERAVHALRRAIRERAPEDEARARLDRRRVFEIERLRRFPRAAYSGATLTQEQIAETLKRIRCGLMTRTLADRLHAVVPVPVAARAGHIRVPEPFAIHREFIDGDDGDAARAALLGALRQRLQDAVDRLADEVEPVVAPYRRANPLAT